MILLVVLILWITSVSSPSDHRGGSLAAWPLRAGTGGPMGGVSRGSPEGGGGTGGSLRGVQENAALDGLDWRSLDLGAKAPHHTPEGQNKETMVP